ncbi:MAG: 4-hydroxy-3-methylbut-2-enyl diphosphate reductase [Deltaproteobacteria bacterium]|nr:4-hydroxy-3-methylbut-2-enyl diphosphate reductase [Deltaproteobacteria bacterium]
MKVTIAQTAGFCMGVSRAVNMALTASMQGGEKPIYTYGPLIHNPQALQFLNEKGISILKNIPKTGAGTIIIRAHGVPPSDKKKIEKAGFNLIDATCPRVVRVQTIIAKYRKLGYTSIIFGDKEHPEVKGLIGCAGNKVRVVNRLSEFDNLPIFKKAVIVAQTTQNLYQFKQAVKTAKTGFPHYKIFNTICDSTRKRQEEIKKLADSVDAAIVIGSYNSGNTCRLAEIASQTGKPSFHIETETDIDFSLIARFKLVGVTAGASTPDWVIKNVCEAIEKNYE